MTNRSTPVSRYRVLTVLVTAFLASNAAAQAPPLQVVPKNEGPVGISDLHVLLEDNLRFQIFEFEAEDDFCLVLGYVHESAGQPPRRSQRNEVVCNVAGPQRLIVVMRPVGDKQRLLFGLHDRNTGAGSTRSVGDFSISPDLGYAAFFAGTSKSIGSDRATTLFRWRFGKNPPHPGPRHDVNILVRLDKNEFGIGSFSKENDFAQ